MCVLLLDVVVVVVVVVAVYVYDNGMAGRGRCMSLQVKIPRSTLLTLLTFYIVLLVLSSRRVIVMMDSIQDVSLPASLTLTRPDPGYLTRGLDM